MVAEGNRIVGEFQFRSKGRSNEHPVGRDVAEGRPSGPKELSVRNEFEPRPYKVKVFNLGKFGVPNIPSISQTAHQRKYDASPLHVHKGCVEFVYCSTGACEYESEGKTFSLSPGMMFVSRPHEAHRQIELPKGHATFCMMFKTSGDKTVRWFADRFAELPRLFACSHSVATLFGRIFALAERGDASLGSRIRMQALVRALLLEILDSTSLSVRQRIPDVFGAIGERMRSHPERDYPLDGLVAEAGVSKASFISLFKKANGLPPRAYLLRCRVEEAKGLLRKGIAVKAVSDGLGFATAQHFSRTFRNFVGTTPRKWASAKKA